MNKRYLIQAMALGLGLSAGSTRGQTIQLSALGNRGFRIAGSEIFDRLGHSADILGDINGDGLADLGIGTNNTNVSMAPGQAWVVFGATQSADVELSSLGSRGFEILGVADDDLGVSLSRAGDVNGDGLDDIVVGAPAASGSMGKTYVVFGKTDSQSVLISDLGSSGFVINGDPAGAFSGQSVGGGIDFNGDGRDDVVVSQPGVAGPDTIHVVLGKTDTGTVELSALGGGGITMNGSDLGGNDVLIGAAAGDVNGDGLGDVIIGNGDQMDGENFVVFGSTSTAPIELSSLGTRGFRMTPESFADGAGRSIAAAGDVNGDGLDDVLIGAPYANRDGTITAGVSYLIFGKTDQATVDFSNLGAGGVQIVGFDNNSPGVGFRLGEHISAAGDFNADGLDDLVIGSQATPHDTYVVFGKTNTTTIQLSNIGNGGMVVSGPRDGAGGGGTRLGGGGDVNGDGISDIIIGNPFQDVNLIGEAFVVFGAIPMAPGEVSIPPGVQSGDMLGSAVASDAGRIVVGIPGSELVAVYRRNGNETILEETIPAPSGMAGSFGGSVAIEGGRILIGAGPAPQGKQLGALHAALFERVNQQWTLVKEISSPESNDQFGASVAISGDLLVVGAPGDASADGAAYLFSAAGSASMKISPAFPARGGFGSAVAAHQGVVAVGAPGSLVGSAVAGSITIIDQITANLGAANVGDAVFSSQGADSGGFGSAVDLDGSRLVAGAPDENGTGAIYRFDLDGNSATEQARIAPDQLEANARFGQSVAIGGNSVAAGAPALANGGGLFTFDTNLGGQVFIAAEPNQQGFGRSVALDSAGTLVVGAPESRAATGAAVVRFSQGELMSDGFE